MCATVSFFEKMGLSSENKSRGRGKESAHVEEIFKVGTKELLSGAQKGQDKL